MAKFSGNYICLAMTFALFFSAYTPAWPEDAAKPAAGKVIVLDDFESGGSLNQLGGVTQGDEEYPGGCIPEIVSDPKMTFGGKGKSLRLDFDVTEPNSFSFYWSKTGTPDVAPGTSHPLDLSQFHFVSFWMKSDEAAPRFGFEIHEDSDGDGMFVLGKDKVAKVLATRYLESEMTEVWRRIVIPFEHFRAVTDWSKVLEVVFVFENKSRSKKGSLFVDNIEFHSEDPAKENPARTS